MAITTCFASAVERHRSLPADDMVRDPIFTSTHAITINAQPEYVWPWITQMGGGRAGWYSWDVIDNGGRPSARSIVPALQTVRPGDIMPALPGAKDAFVVAAVEPPRDLVLTASDGHGGDALTWEHFLQPLDNRRTRLIVRSRASAQWLDLARAKPVDGHRRIFIERAYAVLARLPRPLLLTFATAGHRVMEARHLRGIQRRSTARAAKDVSFERWRTALLACGILAGVLYIAMNLLVGLLWDGYSAADQTISELSAIGAPTRPLWVILGVIYTTLMVAFGWAVVKSAGRNRALRIVGALLVTQAVFGIFWPPMHQRTVLAAGGHTLTDTLHIVWTIATGLCFTFALGVGAAALGKRFRLYSLATMVIVVGCGAWTGTYAAGIEGNLSTPWVGVWERMNTDAFMLWVAILATALLRAPQLLKTPDGR
jgi:hypothetical protein